MHTPLYNNELPHLLHVNGVQMGFVRRGEPSDDPSLVLLHGFTGSAMGWSALLNEFADAGIHVIALDMLGHGQSSSPDDPERYSIEHCHADILAALQQLDVAPQRAILLGYSMGGRIALYTALTSPFLALILESALPGLADPNERTLRRQSDNALADRIEREGVPAFIDYWQNIPLFASQQSISSAQRATLRMQRLNNSATGLANSLRGVGTGVQPALHHRLHELRMPTLLITGALDTKFSIIAQQMARQIPLSSLAIVPGAGHTVHLEQRAHFVSLIRAFHKSIVSI